MLRLTHGNHLESLVDALGDWLGVAQGDPFSADLVVVNSTGLERWLAMKLAERWGVCADVRFVFPNALLDEALDAVLGEEPGDAWSGGALVWSIAAELPALLDDPAFTTLRAWVDAAGGDPSDACVRLAMRLAPAFERYITWRPTEVRRWRTTPGPDWTSRLWYALAARIGTANPAERAEAFVNAIHDGADPVGLPPRIALFAVGSLAPLQVTLLEALGRRRDVQAFITSASDTSWDARAANPGYRDEHPLLASLGRSHADLGARLRAVSTWVDARYVDPGARCTLHAIQSDLKAAAPSKRTLEPDPSLSIHACPGPAREVEVLREQLVALMDADPTLEPRHIAVLTPDIDRYGPLVAALFGDGAASLRDLGAHPSGMPAIPFAIGDRGPSSENPVAAALLTALGLLESGRFDAPTVVDLLSREPVRARFGLAEDRLANVRGWVHQSGVRFGIDAAHRATWDLPARERFTWRFGVDRLLLGTATDADAVILGSLPFGAVEGSDDRQAIGALADFTDALFAAFELMKTPRSMAAWGAALHDLVDRLLDDGSWHARVVRTAITAIAAESGVHVAPLSLGTVRRLLEGRFALREAGRAFLGGGVTVCELVPMRGIPFRVVALLGMNDGAFPRNPTVPSFDLLCDPLPGDRVPREDDRGLLLDTLLAARDSLIVTYTGRDPKDGTARPPAVPIGELLDLVADTFGGRVRAATVHEHPLRAFDPHDFDEYAPSCADRRHLANAAALVAGRRQRHPAARSRPILLTAPPIEALKIKDLAGFMKDPIKRFLKRLRVSFWDDDTTLEDRLPLGLDALQKWALRHQILERRLDGMSARETRLLAVHGSAVPTGRPGLNAFDAEADEAARLVDAVVAALGGARAELEAVIDVAGRSVHGRIGPIGASGLVRWQAGQLRDHQLLGEWVWHVAAHATGAHRAPTTLVAQKSVTPLRALDTDQAREILADLLALYDAGQQRPLPLFGAASRAWAARIARGGDEHRAADDVDRAWRPDGATELVLGDNLPYSDAARALFPPGLDFATVACRVWRPLFAALEPE